MGLLKDAYQDYFKMGNIYTPKDPGTKKGEAIARHFDIITPENIMKPALMQPKKEEYLFDLADGMFEFAKAKHLEVAGHTLVWHQQSLKWLEDHASTREEAIAFMKKHMETVMGRYKGQIAAWDVVNEAIKDDIRTDTSNWREHLRESKWLRLIGDDYIKIAFELAHEIDQEAVLYYNDYNLNYSNKAEATYYMVKELREAGVPIHGIGMQGHYHTNTPLSTVENSIQLFSKIPGIKLSFTELDITVTGSEKNEELTEEQSILQAQKYAGFFQLFKSHSRLIERVTFWGFDDASSWRGDRFPNLWNHDLSPKHSFEAVMDPEGFLAKYPPAAPTGPKQAVAGFNAWGEAFEASLQTTAWEGATATAMAKYNDGALTLKVDVHANQVHANDYVTVYLDLLGNKSETYGADDFHFTVTSENIVEFHGQSLDGLKTSTQMTGSGYEVQLEIPLSQVEKGQVIGLELQVKDCDPDGFTQSVAKWNDASGDSYKTTANFGEIILG
ncbi:MAG: endo-1,4-beta-xylanase [Turicibacter sp.]|nr:endo-1,4-beta-xylanase [Turicibacter sp.]